MRTHRVLPLTVPAAPRPFRPLVSLVAAMLVALPMLFGGSSVALANRFGPPWQSEVTAEQTVVHTQPDPNSAPVGPLPRGAIFIVLGTTSGPNDSQWLQTDVGYVPAQDAHEKDDPWIAEVTVPSLSIYARPFMGSGVRKTAQQDDLLRVTGVSPGLEGDSNIWWATTEGYVLPGTIRQSDSDWARKWTLPDPSLAPGGWWTAVNSTANVRLGPSTDAPIVGSLNPGDVVKVLQQTSGQDVNGNATWDYIDGGRYAGAWVHSSLLSRIADPQPNTTAPDGNPDRWIVVDRADYTLTLVDHGRPVFVTYVAIGDAGTATPDGLYSTWWKFRADDMTSTSVPNAPDAYDLPNVPDTQYYKAGGYALHGTYWHDHFRGHESHGCINVTWTDGRYIFQWTQPTVGANQLEVQASATGQSATPLLIIN